MKKDNLGISVKIIKNGFILSTHWEEDGEKDIKYKYEDIYCKDKQELFIGIDKIISAEE